MASRGSLSLEPKWLRTSSVVSVSVSVFVSVSVDVSVSVSASVFVSISVSQRALMFSAFCVRGPGEDSREEAPQATTEHLVAKI